MSKRIFKLPKITNYFVLRAKIISFYFSTKYFVKNFFDFYFLNINRTFATYFIDSNGTCKS